jgi:transglutaminase-like putative cysteine protease
MKKQWQKIFCIGLAVLILAFTTACPGGSPETTSGNADIPEVTLNLVGDNALTLPGRTEVALATPEEGALLFNGDIRLYVPAGAVSETTPVTIKLCTGTPAPADPPPDDTPQIYTFGNLYDLGPAGIEFSEPVTVTIPYDPALLPTGADESNIGLLYYNGQNWAPVERQIDTVNKTLSLQTKAFPGTLLAAGAAFLPSGPIGWGAVAVLAVVSVVAWSKFTSNVESQVAKDPIYWGKAANYITPDDPTVVQYANWAQVNIKGETKPIKLADLLKNPDALKKLAVDADHSVNFNDGTGVFKNTYLTTENPKDWQLPKDYFKNGLVGDCKNVANGYASMFRHYGYDVMCVDGEMGGERHVWAEVKVDGRPYYLGSDGEFMLLDKAIKDLKLTRPTPNKDGKGYMWDETGQKPYKSNWWVNKLTLRVDTTLTFPGGRAVVEVFGAVGIALDINLEVEDADKKEAAYSGTTDTITGKVQIIIPLDAKASIGTYMVTATNDANQLKEYIAFCVDELKLSAYVESDTLAPGDQLGIHVKLSKPIVTNIQISRVTGSWTTDKNGNVDITLDIPTDAQLTTYTLTVSASQYNISDTIRYTVTIPPTMKVEIQNKEVAPGGKLNIKVTVQPPQATRITVRGYSGTWTTDAKGVVDIPLSVIDSTKPGQYTLIVEAPWLQLVESDDFTVTLTPTITGFKLSDVTVVSVELCINIEGSNEDADYGMLIYVGGQFARTTQVQNEYITASGTAQTNTGAAEINDQITMRQDLAYVSSGTFTLMVADENESYTLNFYAVPRSTDLEAQLKANNGLDALVYYISGADVMNCIRGLSLSAKALGSVSRYYADENSYLMVILGVANEAQITQLLENYN